MKNGLSVLIVCAALFFTSAFCVCAEEIKVGAGAAPTENVLKPVKGPFEKATGMQLTILSSGPKVALMDLERGVLDAASAGLTFEDWMQLMKNEGAEVKDPSAYQQTTIGKDRIVVLTNKDNPVSKLTKDQLKGIFTGKIANWKEVGGKDAPILVVWGTLIPGTNSLFIKNMLDGAPALKEVLDATTAEDIRQNVATNPEAIGIGPLAVIDSSVKSPESPEIARPIILLTKGKPSPGVQKLIDFIKGEGQKYVK